MSFCHRHLLLGLFAWAAWGHALAEPVAQRRVLFLGDSLTAGYGLDATEAYPALIAKKLAEEGWPYEVVNAGVSGDTSAGGLRRIEWQLRQRVEVLVLALGANDGLRGVPVEETARNLAAIVAKARQAYPGVRILLAGMKIPPNYGPDYARDFAALFPRVAREQDLALMPFLLEDVALRRRLMQEDGLHPTAEGQEVMARNVWTYLRPLLTR